MAVHSPTVRRRRLGYELRQLRDAAGLTLEEVGARLEWSSAKLSRIERARVKVSPRDVRDLLDVYGITDETRRSDLILLTREAREKAWWEALRGLVEPTHATVFGLEAEASALHYFAVQVAPGLLQTESYARAVLRGVWTTDTADQVEKRVRLRMSRQELLTREDSPPLWCILDESVLHRRVGGHEVLRGQLRRLIEAAELPNVTLQVLPFASGAHAGIDSAFMIAEFRPPDPDIVCIEYRTGSLYLDAVDAEDEVRQYNRTFDRLQAKAMDPDESIALITKQATDV